MDFGSLIKRGIGMVKIGLAVRGLRSAAEGEKRQRAQHYLVSLLGDGKGLSAKVGQFMTMDSEDRELREALNAAIEPMPFNQVKDALREAYGAPYDTIFKSLDKKGRPASLGQVHFGKLIDGRDIAVKIRYPDIASAVESELLLMGFLPKVGPVARWGFNLDGYRDVFWRKFSEELDYGLEMRNQQRYRGMIPPLREVLVPEVIAEYSKPNILVQRLEEGISVDEAEKRLPSERQSMGRAVLRHYFHMLFRHGFVHSDPHPGNFAFRIDREGQATLIIYDFGSVLEIPESMRLALIRIILALRNREAIDPAACLASLGFDIEKLHDIRFILPALLQILFDPFTTDAPFDVKDWRMSERFEGVVGELKWWFRSAAPPLLIFLMRTLHGLSAMLKRLDAKLPWRFHMDNLCYDLYPAAKNLLLPEVSQAGVKSMPFNGIAQLMKVHVKKPGGTEVRLTMPARVADDLDGVIDDPVKEAIKRQNLNLAEMQDRVRKSGFVPQVIFEVDDPERKVRVWLE